MERMRSLIQALNHAGGTIAEVLRLTRGYGSRSNDKLWDLPFSCRQWDVDVSLMSQTDQFGCDAAAVLAQQWTLPAPGTKVKTLRKADAAAIPTSSQ